jgi:hypothetical protein
MNTFHFLAILGPIFIGVVSRLLPHPPDFTAMNAVAIFGGLYLSRSRSLITLFSTLLLSDLILGGHSTMPFVYLSLVLVILLSCAFKQRISLQNMPILCLASSLLFFFVTNFGVWITTSLYPKTVYGLGLCYLAAIPFLLNQVLGDFAYGALLFVYIYFAEQIFLPKELR